MTRHEVIGAYFDWMCQLVCSDQRYLRSKSYDKLLRFLHSIDFNYTIPMDGNRAEDGVCLRYRFGDEHSYEHSLIASYLDIRPCSVLEMMVALALKCEERIMWNPDIGDQTPRWFWGMIESLRLGSEDDRCFDEGYAYYTVMKFINRDYKRDGKGGLFTVKNPTQDMRSVEIWYQMSWYLNEIMQKGEGA